LLHKGVPEKEEEDRQIGQQGAGEQNRVDPLETGDTLPQNPPKQEEVQNGMALCVQVELSDGHCERTNELSVDIYNCPFPGN
jgi:hypothetical protein